MSSSRRSGRTGCQPVQTPNALAARSTSGRACRRRPRASVRVACRQRHAHSPLVVQRRARQRQPCHQPLRFGRRPPRHHERFVRHLPGRQGGIARLRQRNRLHYAGDKPARRQCRHRRNVGDQARHRRLVPHIRVQRELHILHRPLLEQRKVGEVYAVLLLER